MACRKNVFQLVSLLGLLQLRQCSDDGKPAPKFRVLTSVPVDVVMQKLGDILQSMPITFNGFDINYRVCYGGEGVYRPH